MRGGVHLNPEHLLGEGVPTPHAQVSLSMHYGGELDPPSSQRHSLEGGSPHATSTVWSAALKYAANTDASRRDDGRTGCFHTRTVSVTATRSTSRFAKAVDFMIEGKEQLLPEDVCARVVRQVQLSGARVTLGQRHIVGLSAKEP